jgi:hypothetical protein
LEGHNLWLRDEPGGQRANLEGANLEGANLEGANLEGANLEGANLEGANLEGADLRGANLARANLYGANLCEANLARANLGGADLYEANLRGADLEEANLRGADLYGVNLEGANLRGAVLNWTSHTLVSEILWRVATTTRQQMLAAFIGRRIDWCWRDWLAFETPEREWALAELRQWVKPDDDVPAILRASGGDKGKGEDQ